MTDTRTLTPDEARAEVERLSEKALAALANAAGGYHWSGAAMRSDPPVCTLLTRGLLKENGAISEAGRIVYAEAQVLKREAEAAKAQAAVVSNLPKPRTGAERIVMAAADLLADDEPVSIHTNKEIVIRGARILLPEHFRSGDVGVALDASGPDRLNHEKVSNAVGDYFKSAFQRWAQRRRNDIAAPIEERMQITDAEIARQKSELRAREDAERRERLTKTFMGRIWLWWTRS